MVGHRSLVVVALLCLSLVCPLWSWGTRQYNELESLATGEGETLIERWQASAALQWAEQHLATESQHPMWRFVLAQALFYLGRYEEALHAFEQLAQEWQQPRLQSYRDFVAQTIRSTTGLQLLETPHFRIYLDFEQDAALVPYVGDVLERSYQRLGELFGFFPDEKVLVEIFPTAEKFYPASSLAARDIEVSGAIGICKFNKIMLLSPRNLARGYRWTDALSHEYIHLLLVHLSYNRAPIWLHEGIARYFEDAWRLPQPAWLTRRSESLLAHALAHDSFVGFKNMEPSLVKLDTTYQVQLGYAEAASAIDFIVQRLGTKGLVQVLRTLQQAAPEDGAAEAMAQVMGIDFDAFITQWRQFLQAKKLQEHAGVRLPKFVLKEGDAPATDDLLEEVQSSTARMHSRLGDRLRQRGRVAAATMEYQRALDKDPYSPYLLNKVALTLLAQGSLPEALAHLQRAQLLEADYATTYTNLGRTYLALEAYDEARLALLEAVQINPFDPAVHYYLAVSYQQLGKTHEAHEEQQLFERLQGKL